MRVIDALVPGVVLASVPSQEAAMLGGCLLHGRAQNAAQARVVSDGENQLGVDLEWLTRSIMDSHAMDVQV